MPGFRGALNHNEADAYRVARFFLRLDNRLADEDLTPSQYRAFAKAHTFTRTRRFVALTLSRAKGMRSPYLPKRRCAQRMSTPPPTTN
jgi:hypothetical protein